MKISFLGACREVGKSAFSVKTDNLRLLLDCGIKIHEDYETPVLKNLSFDACILSHAHLDHSGSIPALFKHNNPAVFSTFPTIPLVSLLLEDSVKISTYNKVPLPYTRSELNKALRKMVALAYEQEYQFFDGTKFSFLDAGHIPGSAGIALESKGKKLFYTGDFRLTKTGISTPGKLPKEADALIIESTYAFREHPDRAKLEKDLVKKTKEIIDSGGTALFPCFAIGRTQEMMELFTKNKIADVFVDGMGQRVSDIVSEFPSYVSDPESFQDALSFARPVKDRDMRKRIAKSNSIIITTAGMMDGGPVLSYLQQLKSENAKVFLTGYQVEGTNGDKLVNHQPVNFGRYSEKVTLPFEHFDFSAHAGRKELLKAIKQINPSKVFLVHGDSCEEFAADLKTQGFDAYAPALGESFDI
ncbi:MBL fold metallo-hydrolase [Candidatus Micrarchaeota archaeon]|nr:MBL fold metallo-hydrolase [Candidatus Micrarchaeota archaeon]